MEIEVAEILKKVRKIEIRSRRLTNNIFAGEYHSAFKGKGMAFAEVREYQIGDDIRNIDWNVTARFNHPFVKVFEEERELTVMLLIDVSGSRFFGTHRQLKQEIITEIAAVLAFSVIQNNDKVGALFFSDKVEKVILPQKGRQHALHIIRELLTFQPENSQTNLAEALRYLTNFIKKRCTAFVLSDFIDYSKDEELRFFDALKIANRKHEISAFQIIDLREMTLPDAGIIKMKDAETGNELWVDTSNARVREEYHKWWINHQEKLNNAFSKAGVYSAQFFTGKDYVKPLIQFFEKR